MRLKLISQYKYGIPYETVIFATFMTIDERYMHRCLELARKAAGSVAPNPMVGAVLVYDDQIIGEGWHQQYGEAHAEVNCIDQAIQNSETEKFQKSTLYVSLEPCSHFGNTPPCSDLIIKHQIKKVVIGCRDPFHEVNGKGIEKLKAAGVETITEVLKEESMDLNKRFFTFHTQQRPYILLKWAQTADEKMAPSAPLVPPKGGSSIDSAVQRLLISNELSNRFVHQWRSEEAAILVGTNTALLDDPQLTNRYWPGKQPLRLVIDQQLRLPASLKLFNEDASTIIFNFKKHTEAGQPRYYQIKEHENSLHQIVQALHQMNVQSVMVEGGGQLLQSFIDENLWDEARIICNETMVLTSGLSAPHLKHHHLTHKEMIASDQIMFYKNSSYK